MYFDFLHNFVRNISVSKNKSASYYHKCVLVLMYSSLYFCKILIKFELKQILEIFSNIKFYKNPSSGSRAAPWRQADERTNGHDEIKRRFTQFLRLRLKRLKFFIYFSSFTRVCYTLQWRAKCDSMDAW